MGTQVENSLMTRRVFVLRCETLLPSALQAIVPRSRRVTAGGLRLTMQCSKKRRRC